MRTQINLFSIALLAVAVIGAWFISQPTNAYVPLHYTDPPDWTVDDAKTMLSYKGYNHDPDYDGQFYPRYPYAISGDVISKAFSRIACDKNDIDWESAYNAWESNDFDWVITYYAPESIKDLPGDRFRVGDVRLGESEDHIYQKVGLPVQLLLRCSATD